MSSQDTMNYAKSEEESAKNIQGEIDKLQADITMLQGDINTKSQVIAELKTKQQQHAGDAERLRKQASDEQRTEEAENRRKKETANESLIAKEVKDGIKHEFLG